MLPTNYGEKEEVKVYPEEDSKSKIEILVDDIDTEEQELIIKAVDTSNNYAEKIEKVKGTTKPRIEIKPISEEEPSILQISITCEDNLQKIVIYLGEKRYSTPDNVSIDKKEFNQKVKVENGTTIKVDAYNVSEQMTEKIVTYNY